MRRKIQTIICKKTKKFKKKDKRGLHTKESRLQKKRLLLQLNDYTKISSKCKECNNELDPYHYTTDNDAIVCKYCGLCDNNPIFDTDFLPQEIPKRSALYKHRNYFAERLLQARNMEPRFKSSELVVIDNVYNLLLSINPEEWKETNITKHRFGQICRFINKYYKNTVFTRRQERWLQYRIYCTGENDLILPIDVANTLKGFFVVFSYFYTMCIEKRKDPQNQKIFISTTNTLNDSPLKKTNIPSLDLLILLLLYNININLLINHGWYFLTKNIVNETPSVLDDLYRISLIFDLINNEFKNYCVQGCGIYMYQFFTEHNKKLKVILIDDILNCVTKNEMGMLQYNSMIKNNKPKPIIPDLDLVRSVQV